MSGIVNKVKAALHSDHSSSTTHGTTPTTHGTTTSGSSGLTGTTHNTHGTTGSGLAGTHGTTSNTTAGPHSSNIANKADPRVDSDLDGSRNLGGSGTTGGYSTGTTHGSSGLTGSNHGSSGLTGTTHSSGLTGSNHGSSGLTGTTHGSSGLTGSNHGSSGLTGTNHGTSGTTAHNSNLLNKADPRVDSTTAGTYSGTHTGNNTYGSSTGTHTGTGTHGGISSSNNAGPHNSNMANKADPRVDSDLDGRGNRHGASTGGILGASGSHATAGSGTAQNTAGPHNSDMANKLDPRVDSDRDGSKTIGGNKTHA